jgi:NAD-dependent histone deacetylase SIR2
MGNESSALMDESMPPETLESRSIESVAKYIQEKSIRRIVVMVGVHEIDLSKLVSFILKI